MIHHRFGSTQWNFNDIAGGAQLRIIHFGLNEMEIGCIAVHTFLLRDQEIGLVPRTQRRGGLVLHLGIALTQPRLF